MVLSGTGGNFHKQWCGRADHTATLGDGSALPDWITFDAATRTFSGTPPLNFNGSIDLKVIATDGAFTASDIFTLTVAPVNDAPVASPVTLTAIAEDSGARIITQAELLAGVSDVDTPAGRRSITSACRSLPAAARWSTTATAPGPTRRPPMTTPA